MSAIVTPELVRRYLKATGRHDAGLFETLIQSNDLATVVWGMSLDRAMLGMLAAAEMLLDDEAPEGVDVRGGKAGATDIGRVINLSIAAQARRLINAAGVDPKAWEAAR